MFSNLFFSPEDGDCDNRSFFSLMYTYEFWGPPFYLLKKVVKFDNWVSQFGHWIKDCLILVRPLGKVFEQSKVRLF